MTTVPLPEAVAEKVTTLSSGAAKWHGMSDADRCIVAKRCRAQLATLDDSWVPDNMRCVGLEPSQPDAAKTLSFEPFLFMATVAGRLDKIAASLAGSFEKGETVTEHTYTQDRQLPEEGPVVYAMGDLGKTGPGVTLENWANAAGEETDPSSADTPGVGIVLGAGNQNFLTVVDVLEMAFYHKKCVLLKHHPLRHFMAQPFAHILAPLAEAGAYAQCLDADIQGAHATLLSHSDVKHIHITGSGKTHDKVHATLVAAGREKDVLFTSELGCVTPWIVCPGTSNEGVWPEAQIKNHAIMLAAAFKSSCSMNCLSPKVLMLPSEAVWPQRKAFLEALRTQLAEMPQAPPYYPGAHERFAAFEREYPDAEHIEAPPAQPSGQDLGVAAYPELGQNITQLPSLLFEVGTIGETDCKTYALKEEAFAPVLAIATVACDNAEDFPLKAAQAANDHVFGTLSCNLIYPDGKNEALDKVLQTLNYGCVSVNFWAAMLYGSGLGVWGGAPGSYKSDAPCSGLGFVGNAARIPRVFRSVGISPFENKDLVHDKAMPYILADALSILISGQSKWKIGGLLLRRGFGLFKPMPGGRCA